MKPAPPVTRTLSGDMARSLADGGQALEVDGLVRAHGRLQAEALAHGRLRPRPHRLRARGVVEESAYGRGQGGSVRGRDEPPGDAVLDRLRVPAHGGGDHRL